MSTADRVRVLFQKELMTFDFSTMKYPLRGDYLDGLRVHYDKFIHPFVPIGAVILYLVFSKPLCDFIRFLFGQQKGKNGPIWSQALKYFTAFHSLLLAVYSAWTFYNTYGLVMKMTAIHQAANPTYSWMSAFYLSNCDTEGTLWNDFDFGTWVFHFYLSKYYEFIDTWIILLKDRKPMFLQTFHHAGIVVLMWSFCASHNNTMGICVTVLNSFIHTVMYTYYMFAALGIRLPFKQVITSMQLIQFFTGIIYSTPTYWMENCHTDATWWTQFWVNLYTLVLIGLFMAFAYQEYIVKPKGPSIETKKTK
eukprot:GSChrysophyteH1.ASY1.ANO1.2348.1 assembled CDS